MQNDSFSIRKDMLIGILVGIIILLVGYIILKSAFSPKVENTTDSLSTVDTNTLTEDTQEAPFTIETLGANVKRFSWGAKDLFFNYSPFVYLETEEFIGPDETHPIIDPTIDAQNRIVFSNGSLELFDKMPGDTVERSLRVKFFNGESNPGCQIRRVYPTDEDFIYQPTPGMVFARMKGDACPAEYKSDTNIARAFFTMDSRPDILFFVTTTDGENVSLRTISGAPFFNGIDKISNITTTQQ